MLSRRNYLIFGRVIIDNSGKVLREVTEREKRIHDLNFPRSWSKLEGIDVSALSGHLNDLERIPDRLGSFFTKLAVKDAQLSRDFSEKSLELQPAISASKIAVGDKLFIHRHGIKKPTETLITKIDGPRYYLGLKDNIPAHQVVDVYCPTDNWLGVQTIRDYRNRLSHLPTDSNIEELFSSVRRAYKKLRVEEFSFATDVFQELEDIEKRNVIVIIYKCYS